MTDVDQKLSDHVWKKLSETNPYWSVVSLDKYRGHLSLENRRDFFESGEQNVQYFIKIVTQLSPHLTLSTVIDFGCGVGRLTIPLCRRAMQVFAVDISPAMLDLCQQNCKEAGFDNVIPIVSDDSLLGLNGIRADLIISSITFQHIRPERGLRLLKRLTALLNPGGVLCAFVLISGESDRTSADADLASVLASPESFIEMNVYQLELVVLMLSDYTDQITLGLVPMGKHLGADIFCVRRS